MKHRTSDRRRLVRGRDGLAAWRHDLAFALGVIGDALRGRPFAS